MSGSQLTPVSYIGKTILGIIREIEAYTAVTPIYDTASTINAKRSVVPSLVPTALPTIGYFGIGIGGSQNVTGQNLSEPTPVLMTNMDLYTPIPFRCVPVASDLTATEQAVYRIRVRQTINGADYFCYYLKLLTINQATVQVTQTNTTTGIQTPYTLEYTNLTPTAPPIVANGGSPTNTGIEVNVAVTATLPVTGAEVVEAITVLYAGNLTYAQISEIGIYSGQDQSVTGLDVNGNAITYTEAVLAQLNLHYTWQGDSFSDVNTVTNYQIALGSGSLLLL